MRRPCAIDVNLAVADKGEQIHVCEPVLAARPAKHDVLVAGLNQHREPGAFLALAEIL